MKKKIPLIIILIMILLANKIIFSQIILFSLEKWIDKDIIAHKFDISYKNKEISLQNIVINKKDKTNETIFSAERINLKLKPKSLFSKLIIIEEIYIQKPIINLRFDISINNKKLIDDNLGLLKNLRNKDNPKIYPKKFIDINFLILSSSLENLKFNLERSDTNQIRTINLSNMYFKKFGNEKGYRHYKNVFQIILGDLLLKIPDQELRLIIKDSFNINGEK